MRLFRLPAVLVLLIGLARAAAAQWQQEPTSDLRPVQLRTEYAVDPLGIDVERPRLFWQIDGDGRDRHQRAFRILAASTRELLENDQADLWDSGHVRTDQSTHVVYSGRRLASSQQVFWKVMIWDERGHHSAWSPIATWTMGILRPDDWRAKWIGAGDLESVLLRREFDVLPGLRRAVLHVCGLGQHEVRLNGRKVGDHVLAPGWTRYDRTCLYETFDVTSYLREGANAIGILLGDGMYNVEGGRYAKFTGSFGDPMAIAHLMLEYNDGSREVVSTDEFWRAVPGPITFGDVYGGEDHDARLEQRDWDRPGFDDGAWLPAAVFEGPGGRLRGHSVSAPPVRFHETLEPQTVTDITTGVRVYDFGRNVAIIPSIRVTGEAGAAVRIVPAELLGQDGRVDRSSTNHGNGDAWWQYTLAGDGTEAWTPRFFYHSARYLQVECLPTTPGATLPIVQHIEARTIHTDSEPIGRFSSSSELYGLIEELVRNAQLSNMMSVLTDCPHRERLGWLEQTYLNGPSLRYAFDLTRLSNKIMHDMADAQLPEGLVPSIAPEYAVFEGGVRDSPEWGSAIIQVPWQHYLWTGDIRPLRQYYPAMQRYFGWLARRAENGLLLYGLGDWYDRGPRAPGQSQLTPAGLTATATFHEDAMTLARIALLLGREQDAEVFAAAAFDIREAFNARFFDVQRGTYAGGSQTANAMPLALHMVEDQYADDVLAALLADIRNHRGALTAGDVGHRYVLRALADAGLSDVIHAMHHRTDIPGYGYQIEHGATSLAEAWDAEPRSSQNHFMLGQIVEWFYHDLADIRPDAGQPGFKHTIIHPEIITGLDSAGADYRTLHGTISVRWSRMGDRLRLHVTIPHNTTATVHVPSRGRRVTEGGRPAHRAQGVQFLQTNGDRMIFSIGSSDYHFESVLPVR